MRASVFTVINGPVTPSASSVTLICFLRNSAFKSVTARRQAPAHSVGSPLILTLTRFIVTSGGCVRPLGAIAKVFLQISGLCGNSISNFGSRDFWRLHMALAVPFGSQLDAGLA